MSKDIRSSAVISLIGQLISDKIIPKEEMLDKNLADLYARNVIMIANSLADYIQEEFLEDDPRNTVLMPKV
jgi:hypothetical protein